MARPKGSRNKPKGGDDKAPRTAPTPRTVPDLDDVQARELFTQNRQAYERALEVKKKGDADFKNACKRAKAECGKTAVARIKLAIELRTPEGEAAVRERLADMHQVARWVGADAKLGTQFSMFEQSGRAAGDPVARARQEGIRACIDGEPCKSDYAPDTAAYTAFVEGYSETNASRIAGGIKPLETAPGDDDEGEDDAERDGPAAGENADWKTRMKALDDEGKRLTRGIGDAPPSAEISQH